MVPPIKELAGKRFTWIEYWGYLGLPAWFSSCTCHASPSLPQSTRPADSSSSGGGFFCVNQISSLNLYLCSDIIADLKIHMHDSSIESGFPVERDFVAGGAVVVHAGGHCCHVRLGKGVKERPEILRRPAHGIYWMNKRNNYANPCKWWEGNGEKSESVWLLLCEAIQFFCQHFSNANANAGMWRI